MTVKVASLWEFGWSCPIMEEHQWRMMLDDFGVDEWIMAPITGIDRRVTEYRSIGNILDANEGLVPVYVDEKAEVELADFEID